MPAIARRLGSLYRLQTVPSHTTSLTTSTSKNNKIRRTGASIPSVETKSKHPNHTLRTLIFSPKSRLKPPKNSPKEQRNRWKKCFDKTIKLLKCSISKNREKREFDNFNFRDQQQQWARIRLRARFKGLRAYESRMIPGLGLDDGGGIAGGDSAGGEPDRGRLRASDRRWMGDICILCILLGL